MGPKGESLERNISQEQKQPAIARNFFDLNKEQLGELKKRVSDSQGTIRMLVHPFYTRPTQFGFFDGDKELNSMQDGIKRLTKLTPDKTPPIFVLEEIGRTDELLKSLQGNLNQDLYIIQTDEKSGAPFPEGELAEIRTHYDTVIDYIPDAYNFISQKLGDLGVKRIVIGGMWLMVDRPSEDGKTLPLQGCVSPPLILFARKFKMTLSHFTFPDREKFIKKYGTNLLPHDGFENEENENV